MGFKKSSNILSPLRTYVRALQFESECGSARVTKAATHFKKRKSTRKVQPFSRICTYISDVVVDRSNESVSERDTVFVLRHPEADQGGGVVVLHGRRVIPYGVGGATVTTAPDRARR